MKDPKFPAQDASWLLLKVYEADGAQAQYTHENISDEVHYLRILCGENVISPDEALATIAVLGRMHRERQHAPGETPILGAIQTPAEIAQHIAMGKLSAARGRAMLYALQLTAQEKNAKRERRKKRMKSNTLEELRRKEAERIERERQAQARRKTEPEPETKPEPENHSSES